ncbi:MAG: prenyltransferase [Propionibacteriaceae bacterium]|jgi:1,4-dihydroxy-2-naphthoate octaprenyltransferase|nr:prenyltransferase [Propionibacteriaceae bacterium]
MPFIAGRTLRFWLKASRSQSLGQSLTPYLLGTLLAVSTWAFAPPTEPIDLNLIAAICGFLGVAFAHSGLNLLDDYFDYTSGAVAERQALADGGMRARMGKCAYLTDGLSIKDVAVAGAGFLGVATVFGTLVLIFRGPWTVAFAAAALVLGYLYSGPPLKLSYHALGEVVIGIIFGPVLLSAAYFVACARVDPVAVWASVPSGLLTINILNAHAIMDFGPDKAARRTTLVVALGSQKAGLVVAAILLLASYAAVIIGVVLGALTQASLAVLLTLPLAGEFWRLLRAYVYHPEIDHPPKPWYGPLGNWDTIRNLGIDWFMLRWYLSRNLLMYFVAVLAVASFIRW